MKLAEFQSGAVTGVCDSPWCDHWGVEIEVFDYGSLWELAKRCARPVLCEICGDPLVLVCDEFSGSAGTQPETKADGGGGVEVTNDRDRAARPVGKSVDLPPPDASMQPAGKIQTHLLW